LSIIIILAAQFGYVDVVQYLVNRGVKINQKSKDGWTPLHLGN
jgi:ankyrin repeat protein